MCFIGIIADKKEYNFIEKQVLEQNKNDELKLININSKNISNMKNIKFETIVICNNIENMSDKYEFIDAILKKAQYLIINYDINADKDFFKNNKLKIITYGLNQKSTVTISSVSENGVLICIQRNIEDIYGHIIEVQEDAIDIINISNKNLYSLLAGYIIKKLYFKG